MPLATSECCENRYSGRRALLEGEKKNFIILCCVVFDLDNISVQDMSTEFIECEFRKKGILHLRA